MGASADNLGKVVENYMTKELSQYELISSKQLPYFNDYMTFVGDSVWKKRDSEWEYLFMEQKSQEETIDNSSSWWNWNSKRAANDNGHYNLSGYRSMISHLLGIDPTAKGQASVQKRKVFKWLQVIAQLRHDVLNLDHSRMSYRAVFAIPSTEYSNFEQCFQFYSKSEILNPLLCHEKVSIVKWPAKLEYEDNKYGKTEIVITEIGVLNFFSPSNIGPILKNTLSG